MGKLTVPQIKRLKDAGRYGDGEGLYLNIALAGSKSWVQRIRINGRRLDKGLGGFPTITLAEARRKAAHNKRLVADGIDPWSRATKIIQSVVEDLGKTPTFAEAARRTHKAKVEAGELTNEKHQANWIRVLEIHVLPTFGNVPVDKITQRQVLDPPTRVGRQGNRRDRKASEGANAGSLWRHDRGRIHNPESGRETALQTA